MKPLEIKIKGFGSYKEKQVIDFSLLDDFFLISGDTGAGKTTIFEAMVYALYGKVPGTRANHPLVSRNYDSDESPFVELRYISFGEELIVKRTLKFSRRKKRGDGYKVEDEKLEVLKKQDSTWQQLKGTKTDLNNLILENIKFTADEFSKVVLLPQGEFERFLIADSAEKRTLLEKIFPVELHRRVTDYFREKNNELNSEIKILNRKLEDILKVFTPAEYEKCYSDIEKKLKLVEGQFNKENSNKEELIKLISEAEKSESLNSEYQKIEEQFIEHKKYQKDYEKSLESLSNYDRVIKYRPVVNEYKRITSEKQKTDIIKKEISQNIKSILKNYEKLEKEKSGLNVKRTELEKIRIDLKKLTEDYETIVDAEKNQKIINEKSIELKNLKKEKDKNEERIKNLDEKLKIFTDTDLSVESLYVEKENLTNIVFNQEYELKEIEKHSLSINEIDPLKKSILALEKEIKNLEIEIKELSIEKENHLLSRYSAELEEGNPCPLCGATHHPNVLVGAEFNKKDVENLDKANSLILEKRSEHASLNKELSIKLKNLKDAGFDDSFNFEVAINKKKNELEKNKENLKKTASRIKDIEKMNKEYTALKKDKDDAVLSKLKISERMSELTEYLFRNENNQKLLNKYEGGSAVLEKNIILKKESAEQIEKYIQNIELAYSEIVQNKISLEEQLKNADNKITELNQLYDELEKEIIKILSDEKKESIDEIEKYYIEEHRIENLRLKVKKYDEDFQSFTEKLKLLKSQIKENELDSSDIYKKRLTDCKSNIEKLTLDLKSIEKEKYTVEENKKSYDRIIDNLELLKQESSVVIKISSFLSGKNSRNMTFQDFVLASYMQEVIAKANTRLQKISQGQYLLTRRSEKEKGQVKSGLELNIVDLFNGVEREVQTLSGGEKFLTSLSLALGLADVIQNRAGGIQIEALFIDEGFGALDENTLERAINVLDDIRGLRKVGIISHVKDLKNRIPSGIYVTKTSDGSKANLKKKVG